MEPSTAPILIGFCGLLGSGKDTAAGVLMEEPYGFQRLSFASSLKDVVAALFGWDRGRLEGVTPEDRAWREEPDVWWSQRLGKPITPRSMLQQIGTNCLRQFLHDDIWIATVERTIAMAPPGSRFVISDVRFPNEVKAIEALGGIVVRVQRGELPSWWDAAAKGEEVQGVHLSESALASVELRAVLQNNGTLEEFRERVKGFVKEACGL
jgi:hypothetical protein